MRRWIFLLVACLGSVAFGQATNRIYFPQDETVFHQRRLFDEVVPTGTADGQLLFWDAAALNWALSDGTKLSWDDANDILTAGAMQVGLNTFVFQPAVDSTTAFQILDADGGTPVIQVDTTNEFVGIGTIPVAPLHVKAAGTIAIIVEETFRMRNIASPRYRMDFTASGGAIGSGVNSFDDTAGSFHPFFFDASRIVFRTATTGPQTRVVDIVAGQVGILTQTPDGSLHVHTATAGTVTAHANADDFIVENSDTGGISILVPDNKASNIFFGSPTNNTGAIAQWHHDNNLMKIGTNNTGGELVLYSGVLTEGARLQDGGEFETKFGRIVQTTRVTTTYTILATDHHVFGDTDGGSFTATYPAGVAGTEYRVINVGTSGNALTVAPNGAELLLGVNATFDLQDGETLLTVYEATEGWN